jgi:hypothetical protein
MIHALQSLYIRNNSLSSAIGLKKISPDHDFVVLDRSQWVMIVYKHTSDAQKCRKGVTQMVMIYGINAPEIENPMGRTPLRSR